MMVVASLAQAAAAAPQLTSSTLQLIALIVNAVTLTVVATLAYQTGRLVHRIDVVEQQNQELKVKLGEVERDLARLFPRRFRGEES